MTETVLPIHTVLSGDSLLESSFLKVKCPVCETLFVHAREPRTVDSGDKWGGAGWPGRGSLLVVPFQGECEHVFEVCFGFHKGETVVFVRAIGPSPAT